jgi:hypothetical protein
MSLKLDFHPIGPKGQWGFFCHTPASHNLLVPSFIRARKSGRDPDSGIFDGPGFFTVF